jgi:hypothetical protein
MSFARFVNTKGEATAAAADMSAAPVPVPAPINNNNNIMITITTTAPKTTTTAAKLKGWHAANAACLAAKLDAARVRARARACKLALLARKGRRTAAVLAAGAPQPDNAPADAAVLAVAVPLASITATAETVVPAPTAVLESALIEVPIASDDDNPGNTDVVDDGAGAIAAPTTTATTKLKGWPAAAKAAFVAKASLARSRARALLGRKKDSAAALIEVEACATDAAGSDDNNSEGAPLPAAAGADAGRLASMRVRMISAWAALAGHVSNAAAAPKAATKATALTALTAVRGYFSTCVAPSKKAIVTVA